MLISRGLLQKYCKTGNLIMFEPLVSISCTTYNHEKYIADSIEGFLMQKTDFPFEILIHDDASTDRTAEIVRSYEKKYPDIIKPIYQIENQHSQGNRVSWFNFKRAKGKFIAICEGDDYWTDPYKLQKQVDIMERNPTSNICFHPVKVENSTSSTPKQKNRRYPKRNQIITPKDIIKGGSSFIATCSILIRNCPNELYMNPPEWTKKLKGLSVFIKITASLNGGAIFIADYMAVYRENTESSFTRKVMQDHTYNLSWAKSKCYSLDKMDEMTGYKYSAEFNDLKKKHWLGYILSVDVSLRNKKSLYGLCKPFMPSSIKIIYCILTIRFFSYIWRIYKKSVPFKKIIFHS